MKRHLDSDRLEAELQRIARGAGEIHMRYFDKLDSADVGFKGPRDLLTVADKESEAFVVAELRRSFPNDAIWAEEAGHDPAAQDALEAGAPVWFIDPLDGTTNFVHGHPFFCVALGLFQEGQPVAGVIFAPRLDELFITSPGRTARLNGRSIEVSATGEVKDALLATGFAYRLETAIDDNTEHFRHVVRRARGVRRCGAACLDLAYVAAGRYDGFWELDLEPWDVAAGAAIVRAAGGRVTDIDGGESWLLGRRILATNGHLHSELHGLLRLGS
jgi:myo-inositol-1(or 4)-monophosphatase